MTAFARERTPRGQDIISRRSGRVIQRRVRVPAEKESIEARKRRQRYEQARRFDIAYNDMRREDYRWQKQDSALFRSRGVGLNPDYRPYSIWKKREQKEIMELNQTATDPKVLYTKLKENHLNFLTSLSQLWPLTLERKILMEERGFDALDRLKALDEQQKLQCDIAMRHLKATYQCRLLRYNSYEQSAEFRAQEDALCRGNFIHWIDWWAFTEDPRLPPLGLPSMIPMVLWPRQEAILLEFDYCYRHRLGALVEKSREMGATWMFISYMMHHFIYEKGFKASIASRLERLVDEWGNPDTLFSKLRFLMYRLPKSMRPSTFQTKGGPNDNLMRMINPDTDGAIIGESGDNIGRGGRSSMTLVDEAAFLEHPELVDSALSSNTNCQLDLSTPNGPNAFYKKRKSGGVKVLTMRWWNDPSKNPAWGENTQPENNPWYEYQKLRFRHDPTIVAREIDINYHASVEGVFIDPKWVQAAVCFAIDPVGDRAAGFDIAGGGKNSSVYALRVGPVVTAVRPIDTDSATSATWKAVEYGQQDKISVLNYDGDGGYGETAKGLMVQSDSPIPFVLNGIRGNASADKTMRADEGKTGNQKYRNKRAELWDGLRQRFRKTYEHVNGIRMHRADEMISIPDDNVLVTQLSSPKEIRTASGKIGVESKEAMRARGIDSPDYADAVVYAFADYDESELAVGEFNYTAQKKHFTTFEVDFGKAISQQFAVVYQDPSLTTHVLCCMWWASFREPKLQVYDERVFENRDPAEVVAEVKEIMQAQRKPIAEWIANEGMFGDTGKTSPWFLYRKAGALLHRNYSDDDRGSLMLVNQMFRADMIRVHTRCRELMLQLSYLKRGDSRTPAGLVKSLCLVVTRLKIKKLLTPQTVERLAYNGAGQFAVRSPDDFTLSRIIRSRG